MATGKVVQLTSVHGYQDTRIFHKECCTLAGAGYTVVLIVPHDRDEVARGVQIRAVPRPGSRRQRMTRTLWQIYRAALRERGDVYHFHDPELIAVGLLLKLRGKRVVYDVHEDVPRQILSKHWVPKPLRRAIAAVAHAVEQVACRWFDGVVAATPAVVQKFPAAKSVTVQNFPVLHLPPRSPLPYREREPLVVYVGGLNRIRGAKEMVAAIDLVPRELGARLVLAGTFTPPGLEAELRQMPGWARTDCLGWLTQQQVRDLLGRARVGLALLHPEPNYVECYSTKSFEYMQAGLPVVASNFPLWCELIGGPGAGLLVDPLDPSAIADAVAALLRDVGQAEAMGERGRAAVYERYNWEREAAGLQGFYQRLAGPAVRGGRP
ncbi:MAG TPA: glycosyltransferase family 4 protein [Symbiobacteriaceae bacterium]|nr:glycosyltransferase family 4 protein [Symbiobacteriaceae bacterium]